MAGWPCLIMDKGRGGIITVDVIVVISPSVEKRMVDISLNTTV